MGVKNDLQQALADLDQDKIRQELLNRNCDWVVYKMNVPHASHMGSVLEHQIWTVSNIMETILLRHRSHLDDKSLHTFMAEADAVANCRPLTVNDLSSPECPTCSPWNPVWSFLVHDPFSEQIYTPRRDGTVSNIWWMNSGSTGRLTFSNRYNQDKNGSNQAEMSR